MRFSIEPYLSKTFNDQSYNCFDFVREVWKDLTGVDLGHQTPSKKSICSYTDKALSVADLLTELPKPNDPCIVLLLRQRSIPHVGVFFKNKVLHLGRSGAQYVLLCDASRGFDTVKFYT